jgi:hypothetical protein
VFGPVSSPTRKDFFVRGGGVLAVMAVTVLVTGALSPGHEGHVVIFVAAIVVAITVLQRRNRRGKSNAGTNFGKNVK